jgi:outer membrane protein assembly factor BamB
LLLEAGKLYLSGGNAVSPAVYDVGDGRCLSEFPAQWQAHSSPRGQDLFLIQGRVHCFDRRLYGPNRYWPGRGVSGLLVLAEHGETMVRDLGGRVTRVTAESVLDKKPKILWQSHHLRQTCALALGSNAVVVAGELADGDQAAPAYAVAALSLDDGGLIWSRPLPEQPAWWGLATDKTGRIFVSLLGGRVLCFQEE